MNQPTRHNQSHTRPAFFLSALALTALYIFFSLADQASAHGVYIFAWADGPRICTQSYFSKSSKVMGGEVLMADSRGTILDKGRSDDDGMLCFSAPKEADDLTFTVKAGQGHRGEFLLPASDVRQALEARQKEGAETGLPLTRPEPTVSGKAAAHPAPLTGPPASHLPVAPAGHTTLGGWEFSPSAREELCAMIRQEIRQELSPIRQALAEQKNDASPGMRDIIGGLGWIFGLAAAGALYYKRGKGK